MMLVKNFNIKHQTNRLKKCSNLLMTQMNSNNEKKIQPISLDRMAIYSFGVTYKELTLVQKINVHLALLMSDLIVMAILTHKFFQKRYLIIKKVEKKSGDVFTITKLNKKVIIKDLLIAFVGIVGTIVLKQRFGRIISINIKKTINWFISKLPTTILKKTFNLFKKILYQAIFKPIKIIFNLTLLPFKIVFKIVLKLIAFPFIFLFKIIKNRLFQIEKDSILKEQDLTVEKIQEYIRKYKGEDTEISVPEIITIINTRLNLERSYMRQIKICLALLRALHEEDITWEQFMKYVLFYGTDEFYALIDFIRRGGRALFSSKKYPENLPPVIDLYREPENAIHRRFIQPFSKKPPTNLPPLSEPRIPPFAPLVEPEPTEPTEELYKKYEDIINETVKFNLPKGLKEIIKPISTIFIAYALANFAASPKTQKEFNWILKNFNADPGLKPVSA